jgi:hypothetical protein
MVEGKERIPRRITPGCQLQRLARGILPDYLSKWPRIRQKLVALLEKAVPETELPAVIKRNERLFGLTYPDDVRQTPRTDQSLTVTCL